MSAILSYVERDSVIHKMTGTTKLFFFLFWSIAAMITYDTRVLVGMFLMGCVFFKISKLKWNEISFALVFMFTLMAINIIGIYVFAPEQGVEIYGTRHELTHLFWRYSITSEQLFYMFNFLMKYMAVIPVALLFIMTTNPSEFAASMNKIGISYRVGYAVAIALRYIPDVQRDYREISQAQQARGISLGKEEKTPTVSDGQKENPGQPELTEEEEALLKLFRTVPKEYRPFIMAQIQAAVDLFGG